MMKLPQPYRQTMLVQHGSRWMAILSVAGIGAELIRNSAATNPSIPRTAVDSLFGGDWLKPQTHEIERLHEALELMRGTVHPSELYRHINAKRIEGSLQAILADLPPVVEYERLHIENAEMLDCVRTSRQRVVQDFETLIAAAKKVRDAIGNQKAGVRKATWHADSIWLAGLLAMIAHRTGHELNFKRDSRREALFIEAALDLAGVTARINGQSKPISATAIAREFSRREKAGQALPDWSKLHTP